MSDHVSSLAPAPGASSRSTLLRDLTLSPEAPMAFCLRLLLQQMMWTGRPEQLFELIGTDPRQMDLVDVRNLLLRLGYGSRLERLEAWSQLNPQLLKERRIIELSMKTFERAYEM